MTEDLTSLLDLIYSESLKAREVLRGVVHETPLDYSSTFSSMTSSHVYLKLENLQKTGSFKIRGAYYKIYSLGDEAKRRGVIAVSAGNHAQGVAYASRLLGVKATIVMPVVAPLSKIAATRSYGADVVLHGNTIDDSMEMARKLVDERGLIMIHPYDDPQVIAGQGTISLEVLEQMPEPPDVVIIPIGGGGLISGNAVVLKKRLGPRVKVIGVEPSYLPKYTTIIKERKEFRPSALVTGLMDGLIVKTPGKLTERLIGELVDDIVTVDDKEVARAMFLLLERGKTVAEGAGAAALAALLEGKVKAEGKKVVVLISGGNVDLSRLSNIVNYELFRSRRIIKLTGSVPDQPGWLDRILRVLADARFNVIDIIHDRYSPSLMPGWARVEVLVEAPDPDAVPEAIEALRKEGLSFSEVKD